MIKSGGTLLGGFKGNKEGKYTLVSLDKAAKAQATLPTEHQGGRLLLRASDAGLVALSWDKAQLRISAHNTLLEAQAPMTMLAPKPETAKFYEVQAVSLPGTPSEALTEESSLSDKAAGGILVAASTGFGVQLLWLNAKGEVVGNETILKHPEMPYCRKLALDSDGDGWRVRLRCQDVVPMAPAIEKMHAVVTEFDYDAEEPPLSDLTVWVDQSGQATKVTLTAGEDQDQPERYELKRTLSEEIPRPSQHRVYVLDAQDLEKGKALSLICVGPDDGTVEVQAVATQCPEN